MAMSSAETAKGASDADILPVFHLSYSAADAGSLIDTLQPAANPAALLRLNGAPRARGAASALAVAEA